MSDPKETKPAEKEADSYTLKDEIRLPQRDGTHVVVSAGVVPMADAKRYAKAGLLDLNTGKAPKEK